MNWRHMIFGGIKIVFWSALFLASAALGARAFILHQKVELKPIAPDVAFEFPVHVLSQESDPDKIFVVQKNGLIHWVRRTSLQSEGTVLDLRNVVYQEGHEEGMLSLAFDPSFPVRPYIYVFYNIGRPLRSRLSRFTVGDNLRAEAGSELILLELLKPDHTHNGGLVLFGPDGYLYVSIGDGGKVEAVADELPFRRTLFGSILRIDVRNSSAARPYAIPPDNPFSNEPGARGEIWAYGLRNPWRFSFDKKSGEMIAADVGVWDQEEIDVIRKGGYYGWPFYEALLCHRGCPPVATETPIAVFDHRVARSLTGAILYRGDIESLRGRVLASDYLRGLYSFVPKEGEIVRLPRVEFYKLPTRHGKNRGNILLVSSLSEGAHGEVFVANSEGEIYELAEIGWWSRIRGFFYSVSNFR